MHFSYSPGKPLQTEWHFAFRAEARKKHAEADTLEFNNKVRRLRLVLGAAKTFMVGDTGEEAVIFTAQITAFLETLDNLTSS